MLFAREAARIRAALDGRAVQVEHVGSTSVPGLTAKPIIDILLAVPDSADEQAYVPALEAASKEKNGDLKEAAAYALNQIEGSR